MTGGFQRRSVARRCAGETPASKGLVPALLVPERARLRRWEVRPRKTGKKSVPGKRERALLGPHGRRERSQSFLMIAVEPLPVECLTALLLLRSKWKARKTQPPQLQFNRRLFFDLKFGGGGEEKVGGGKKKKRKEKRKRRQEEDRRKREEEQRKKRSEEDVDDDPEFPYSQEYNAGKIGLLSSITQVHKGYMLGAINELQDNAVEAQGKNQWIRLTMDRDLGYQRMLSFLDDGKGLDKRAWSRLLSLGERSKGKHNFGVGCKTGSFSIGKEVLIFSKGIKHGSTLSAGGP
jgi:hypothetical protein